MLINYSHKRRLYYLLFAISFGFVWYLFKLGGIQNTVKAFYSTIIDIFFSLTALIITVELLLPRLFYNGRRGLFMAGLLLVIIATGSLTVISQLGLMGYSLAEFYSKNLATHIRHYYYWFWSDLVLGTYFMISFISIAGFAIRLSFDRIITVRDMENMEKERSMAELETLKNQINPHFLFNALNTIYYKIDRSNAPARSMVEQFSSLLRYQLYECNLDEVAIEKELKFITDYIELQQERLGRHTSVTYRGIKGIHGFLIAPFILMPLVENCFKHVSKEADKENAIIFRGKFEDGWFYFESSNTVMPAGEINTAGIGLTNVKKRLELIYANRHSLITDNNGERFNMLLKINIG